MERNYLNVRAEHVIPIQNIFRIALANEKNDRRRVGRRIVRKKFQPARANETGFFDPINVIGERQRNHISLDAVDDCKRLIAAGAVRGLESDLLAADLLPNVFENFIILLVEFARGVVGDVEELLRCFRRDRFVAATRRRSDQKHRAQRRHQKFFQHRNHSSAAIYFLTRR